MGISDDLFIETAGLGFPQLLTLILLYAFILFKASKLIADGSELLTLVLNPGLIGGLVLPIMGAVPDGSMVLFSGLGPDAQEQLNVGIGTLAGSTIMLLTIPWAASMIMGRVDLNAEGTVAQYRARPKLTKGWSLGGTGVQLAGSVPIAAYIMLASTATYFIVQVPAWVPNVTASDSRNCALAGFVVSAVGFVAYSAYQVYSASSVDRQRAKSAEARKKAIENGVVSLFDLYVIESEKAKGASAEAGSGRDDNAPLLGGGRRAAGLAVADGGEAVSDVMRGLFTKFDADGNGSIDKTEMRAVLASFDLRPTPKEIDELMTSVGGADGIISFSEFSEAVVGLMRKRCDAPAAAGLTEVKRRGSGGYDVSLTAAGRAALKPGESLSLQAGLPQAEGGEEDDEEEEEESEGDAPRSRTQIMTRAFGLLALGVLVVTVFSDPMVSALSAFGTLTHIPAFYIAFIITPLVSNASELISSIIFSGRKTSKSITMTFEQLLGAAAMNNTFCLSIFLALVYFRNLEWAFSAEVIVIIIVEVVMAIVALTPVQPLWRTLIPAVLYPGSIGLVAVLTLGPPKMN